MGKTAALGGLGLLLLGLPGVALAQGHEAGGASHADPLGPVLFALVIILFAAKAGGALFLRMHQPAVLGELVAGVILGNALLPLGLQPETAAAHDGLVGWWARFVLATVSPGTPLDILARLGVVLLLFLVGLESNLKAMLRVGVPSLLVASLGVLAPFVLGYCVARYTLPGGGQTLVYVYIGATLCATSVGITARVYRELGRLDREESRIVLGAAVIDDVMGLVILAVVSGMITAQARGTTLNATEVGRVLSVALAFLVFAVAGGLWLAPRAFALTARLRGEGVLLVSALGICFTLAGLAAAAGLAPIVGAFAAGLLLDEVHYIEFRRRHGSDHKIEDLLVPVGDFLVPIFFVQMGMTVKLSAFAQPGVLWFAALLTLAAILGKQACGLAVPRHLDRLSIGLGMIPRGEVGLIFAAIGHQLRLGGQPVIGDVANAAVVIMVILTTLATPPLLQWSLRRADQRASRAA